MSQTMREIDGAAKSGSGTIVRDAAAFATLAGQPVRVRNIRAKRDKPGLRPQHRRAVEAVAALSGGTVEGAEVGSREIAIRPGERLRGGDWYWDIGTAGSATMLAFTVLPVALAAGEPSSHVISGGLFQDYAPTALHLEKVFLPLLRRTGAEVRLELLRPGYVPTGGGRMELAVTPPPAPAALAPLSLEDRGKITRIRGISLASRLKNRQVADRMANAARKVLEGAGCEADIEICSDEAEAPVYEEPAPQPGAALLLWAETDTGCLIGADMAGARGRSSEEIGRKSAQTVLEEIESGAAVDRHVADQLIPYAALADGVSRIAVPRITGHVETRLWLVEKLLGADVAVEDLTLVIRGSGALLRR